MENMQDEIFNKMSAAINKQYEEFVISKFIAKGYHIDISMTFGKVRFPKYNVSIMGEWKYFFADNGTKQGEFIVAIKDWSYSYCALDNPCSVKGEILFEWQDTSFEPVRLP